MYIKSILISIVAVFSLSLTAQETKNDSLRFDFSVLMSNTQFGDSILDMSNNLNKFYNKQVTRDLDFDVQETIFRIKNIGHIPDKYYSEYYKLEIIDVYLLSRAGAVMGIITKTWNDDKPYFLDDAEINLFIQKHDLFYNTNTSVKDLVRDILSESSDYLHSVIPEKLKSKDFFDHSFSDIDAYRIWLKSYNVEAQSEAVDMLNYLYHHKYFSKIGKIEMEKQIDLKKQDEILIQHIKQRNSLINVCKYCLADIYKRVY